MANIAVIGSANMDTTGYLKEFPDKITSESLNNITDTTRVLGGKGANQAVSAVLQSERTRNKVYFIGCVGKDEAGLQIISSLKEKEIDYSGVEVLPNTNTDGRIILVDENGDNRMLGYGECIKQLTPAVVFDEKRKKIIENADIIMIQMKMPAETVEAIVNYCAESNKTLLIDPTPIEKSDLLIRADLLDKTTYLTPNEEEAYALAMYEKGYTLEQLRENMKATSREDIINEIRQLVKSHPNVIATLGDKGVIYFNNGQLMERKPYPTKCIDSTGAGDTFNGAFIAAIARGESMDIAIDYALMDCANKVQNKGAQNGMQTRKETERDLDRINTH